MKLQLDCQQVSRLLSDRQDRNLGPADGATLALHLLICRHCRSASEQLAFVRAATRQWRLQRESSAGQDEASPLP